MTAEPRPLRVLWVIKGLGPGGAERLLVTLAEVRDPEAVSYEVAYLLARKQHLVPELEAAGVSTHLVGRGQSGGVLWPWRLRRLIITAAPDVVHTQSPVVASVTRLLVRTLRRRPATVYTEHNHWQAYGRLTRLANRLTHGLDDRTFAVSNAVRDSVQPPDRRRDVTVLIHGINRASLQTSRDRQEVRAELDLHETDLVVITVANMRPQKAYPDLLMAAEKVLAAVPRAHFLAVGQGPLLEQTRAEAHRLGISDRFHVLGERSDVFDLLGAADCFALASVWEGFPIAVMEGMSMGLPVVATRVGGVPDAVDDGGEGYLVEPRRPADLADAIVRMLSDEPRRRVLGEAARARAVQFDIRHTSATLLDAYVEVTTGSSRRPALRPAPGSRG